MSKHITLAAVLDAFAEATDQPLAALVREWTQRYPQFEREIVDFAVEWAASDLVDDVVLSPEEDDQLVNHTVSHLQQVRQRLQAGHAAACAVACSAEQIQRVEAAFRARSAHANWPASLRLDDTIMALLQGHLILPPVPRRLLDELSSSLGVGADALCAWLFQPHRRQTASYAAKTPAFAPWTFEQAIEHSTLPDEDKQQWLRET